LARWGLPTYDPTELIARAEYLAAKGVVKIFRNSVVLQDVELGLLKGGEIIPVKRNGEIVAMRLFIDPKPGSALEGIAKGDIFLAINGRMATNPNEAQKCFNQLVSANVFVVEFLRGKQLIVLVVTAKSPISAKNAGP